MSDPPPVTYTMTLIRGTADGHFSLSFGEMTDLRALFDRALAQCEGRGWLSEEKTLRVSRSN